ncbi:hypothetical protein [Terriglobus aquaticus]|uniref:Glycosyltransferase RgtA/B/C/D-like domain-containing protein n=2 Tax=Terriglobus aquaticus TaxID=940139 RepID=A0ABW9KI41_9BACT
MLGWMLLHDPSWSHMIYAWKQGADGGGFLFYLLGRGWFAIFGASDLAFRLFSATCFGAAFCITWAAARRFYSVGAVAFAMFNTWFFSPSIVTHMAEGRFYGLLMLSTSLVVALAFRIHGQEAIEHRSTRTSMGLCLLTFFLHGLLTASHTLGILYSAALLLGAIVLDAGRRRFQWPLYAAAAASWILLLPERTAIRASAQVGKPWFWTRPPGPLRFIGAFTSFSREITVLLFVMCILVFASQNRSARQTISAVAQAFSKRRAVYVVVGALCLVPVGMAIGSHIGTSLFIDRYLLPLNIATALITMELVHLVNWHNLRLGPDSGKYVRPLRLAAGGLFALALLYSVFVDLRQHPIQSSNYTDRLTAQLPKGAPVVCEDAWAFTELIGRQHSSGVLYTYLLDWPQSIRSDAPRLEVTQYHLMENWKRVGYFSGSIYTRDDFLQHHDRFFVLTRQITPADRFGRFIGNPLAERFAHTPGYQVRMYAKGDPHNLEDPNVWLVCRENCSP